MMLALLRYGSIIESTSKCVSAITHARHGTILVGSSQAATYPIEVYEQLIDEPETSITKQHHSPDLSRLPSQHYDFEEKI